jgi:hypothetical protein
MHGLKPDRAAAQLARQFDMPVRHLALIALLIVSAACGRDGSPQIPTTPSPPSEPAPPPQPPPSPTRWSLSGTVTDDGTKLPLVGARVEIVEGVNQGAGVATGEEGRYKLENLEPGAFSLQIKAEGFDNERRSVTLSGDQTIDVGLRKPAPPARGTRGTIVDGLTEHALPGVTVRVEGLAETTTASDGTFLVEAPDPEQVRPVVISSAATIERSTHLRVPGPTATVSLMPSSLDLRAFDEMFRSSGTLRRWTTAPRIVVQTRVLQFTNVSDVEFTALDALMSDSEASAIVADLTWALPQLTGNAFSDFAGQTRETAAPNDRVNVQRSNLIVVARYEGLTAATGFWGYTRWAWNGAGEIQAAIVMLDRSFDTSDSPFRRSLRSHELGHALGYQHVTGRESVMNSNARLEPNGFDRDSARLAFLRPPLNRSPDVDPDPFTTNLRAFTGLIWSQGMH